MSGSKNFISIQVVVCCIACYVACYITCVFRQGEGALTYAGKKRSPTVYGPHHTGKESLDINLLKAERHSAAPLGCDDDAAPEWVTYN